MGRFSIFKVFESDGGGSSYCYYTIRSNTHPWKGKNCPYGHPSQWLQSSVLDQEATDSYFLGKAKCMECENLVPIKFINNESFDRDSSDQEYLVDFHAIFWLYNRLYRYINS